MCFESRLTTLFLLIKVTKRSEMQKANYQVLLMVQFRPVIHLLFFYCLCAMRILIFFTLCRYFTTPASRKKENPRYSLGVVIFITGTLSYLYYAGGQGCTPIRAQCEKFRFSIFLENIFGTNSRRDSPKEN